MRWSLLGLMLFAACERMASEPVELDAGAACLEVSPLSVDFGEVEVASSATITVTNGTSATAPLRSTRFLEAPFDMDSVQFSITPGVSTTFDVQFRPHDGLLHFTQFELESSDDCVYRMSLSGLGKGLVEVSPERLDFGPVAVGQTRTLELVIRNTRRVPVTLEGITLFDVIDAPTFGYSGPTRLELPPSSLTRVAITATPPSVGRHRASFEANNLRPVNLEVSGGVPIAQLSPSSIDVPILEFSEGATTPSFVERVLMLENLGDGVLTQSFLVEQEDGGASSGDLEVLGDLTFVRPGAQVPLRLGFRPNRLGPHDLRVRFFTNDPGQPEHQLAFHGFAYSVLPCSLQVPAEVTLTADAMSGSTGKVRFVNIGTTPCVLDDVRMDYDSAVFRITDGGVEQVQLAPGQTHEVSVVGPDAGTRRADTLGFHVLGPNSIRKAVILRPPP